LVANRTAVGSIFRLSCPACRPGWIAASSSDWKNRPFAFAGDEGNSGCEARNSPRGWWARNQHRLAPYLFLTPFAVLFLVWFAYPVGYAFYLRLFRRYDDLMGSPRRAACAPQSRRLDYCQWRTDPPAQVQWSRLFAFRVGAERREY
jgi:hypothetical protein